jgi:hypothetical protein
MFPTHLTMKNIDGLLDALSFMKWFSHFYTLQTLFRQLCGTRALNSFDRLKLLLRRLATCHYCPWSTVDNRCSMFLYLASKDAKIEKNKKPKEKLVIVKPKKRFAAPRLQHAA